jgi:ABC-type branched-subunit amino acid transport system ATPase component
VAYFQVDSLVKSFAGLTAVNGVSFTVAQGEIFALIGPNGSGKTTTFNLITGYLRPTSGRILFKGQEIHRLKSTDYRAYHACDHEDLRPHSRHQLRTHHRRGHAVGGDA